MPLLDLNNKTSSCSQTHGGFKVLGMSIDFLYPLVFLECYGFTINGHVEKS